MKLVVLGRDSGLYTRAILVELALRGLHADVIIEGSGEPQPDTTAFERILRVPSMFMNIRRSWPMRSLPVTGGHFWRLLLEHVRFRRSAWRRELIAPYLQTAAEAFNPAGETIRVGAINDSTTHQCLKQRCYDLGLLGGVGIVSREILDTFSAGCLNAHPAPLPACRGGGALQQTLSRNLTPAASVHFVTADVDGGPIVTVDELAVDCRDSMPSLAQRLEIQGAKSLARVAAELANGVMLPRTANTGEMHYWRDCDEQMQIRAWARLQLLKRQASQTVS